MDEFVNEIKKILEDEGINWEEIEHKNRQVIDNVQSGVLIIKYNIRIPYLPKYKPGGR